MELVFKRDKTKKYICTVCEKEFNWDNQSRWYGNYIDDKPEGVFCSVKCSKQWQNENKKKS